MTMFYSFKRIINVIIFSLFKGPLIPSSFRYIAIRLTGVRFEKCRGGGAKYFIGKNVTFDNVRPELITIGNNSFITQGVVILTHFYDPEKHSFYFGEVRIGENVFIGCNSVISKPVSIGDNACIAAQSVVTKDIPANELWGGVPAKFIKNI